MIMADQRQSVPRVKGDDPEDTKTTQAQAQLLRGQSRGVPISQV